jgi:hypothetical protein
LVYFPQSSQLVEDEVLLFCSQSAPSMVGRSFSRTVFIPEQFGSISDRFAFVIWHTYTHTHTLTRAAASLLLLLLLQSDLASQRPSRSSITSRFRSARLASFHTCQRLPHTLNDQLLPHHFARLLPSFYKPRSTGAVLDSCPASDLYQKLI